MSGGLDVRSFTVGPIAENTYMIRRDDAERALLIDPGAEPERLIAAIEALGVTLEAILITHVHFDHVGAVAALARHTRAPVYCPSLERQVLADLDGHYAQMGFGPFESHEAEELLAGGERLELAGLEIEVAFTPGHSPGHLSYAIPKQAALFSGDVLFAGSVGRVDVPGGDSQMLLASIAGLLDSYPAETRVYPGHMSHTTLGAEREHNPYLAELRSSAAG